MAWDDETGETVSKQVVQTFVRETNQLVTLETDQEQIVVTPEHPFWVEHQGYTKAGKLTVGDVLITYNNQRVKVKAFRLRILARPVTVYNFEVDQLHNYYAGISGVLVHNSSGGDLTFKDGELEKHFNKHGDKIKNTLGLDDYTINDYLNDANEVIKNGTYSSDTNAYLSLIPGVEGKSTKFGIVGVTHDGQNITTFHTKRLKEVARKNPSLGINK